MGKEVLFVSFVNHAAAPLVIEGRILTERWEGLGGKLERFSGAQFPTFSEQLSRGEKRILRLERKVFF
jgi:hypothetical protein